MNKLEHEFVKMQIDVLSDLLKEARSMVVYSFDLRDENNKEITLPISAQETLKEQNRLHTSHFRKIGEIRDRLSTLLNTQFK